MASRFINISSSLAIAVAILALAINLLTPDGSLVSISLGPWGVDLPTVARFPQWLYTSSKRIPQTASHLPPLLDATISELAKGLSNGDFSSVDLVRAYTARIREVNPTLHAITELNPDAEAIAEQLDLERQQNPNQLRGPLHGVPILLKANMATTDKMSTSAGSFALLAARPPDDATVVKTLRRAGAVILGKANLSQWANFRSLNSTDGWSAYGGQCLGAYATRQNPLGSSSGSAVAASIGLAAAALGTETSGSIVAPAGFNNVVGIKPTVGRTSRHLVVPVSARQDSVGPLARTVTDAAIMLQALVGEGDADPRDKYTLATPAPEDYVSACVRGGLRGKRIGVPRNLIPRRDGDEAMLAAFEQAIDTIEQLGATVIHEDGAADVTDFSANMTLQRGDSSFFKALQADFRADLPALYLSQLAHNPFNLSTLEDVRGFTQSHPSEAYPARDTGLWDGALGLPFRDTSDKEHGRLLALNREVADRQGMLGVMRNLSLDALVMPTDGCYYQAGVLGTPIVSVPMGAYPGDGEKREGGEGEGGEWVRHRPHNDTYIRAPNVPFGLSFLGARWTERELVAMAYDFEQAAGWRARVRPVVQPGTEIWDVLKARSG